MPKVGTSTPPKAVAGRRYHVQDKLGAGAFAQVWRAVDTSTQMPVAIKFENSGEQALLLEDEAEIMRLLATPVQPQGFVKCLFSGDEGPWQFLVMDLLGTSLEARLQACGGRFEVPTTVLIAEQALQRLEYLHSKGIVHRDIKPENLVLGTGSRVHHLHLIDFGLSKRYYDRGHVKPNQRKQSVAGTVRYASLNALRGCEQSRRDDLEALGYVLVYLLLGSLPWSGLPRPTPRAILAKKSKVSLDDLCGGLPGAFKAYLVAVRALGFEERPDYDGLHQSFCCLRANEGPLEDHQLQWLCGQDLGPLEPLIPREEQGPRQPDDGTTAPEASFLWDWLGGCRLPFCICSLHSWDSLCDSSSCSKDSPHSSLNATANM